jgi:hypothetical protein
VYTLLIAFIGGFVAWIATAGSSVCSLSNTEILYKKKNRNNSGSSPVRKLGRSTELNAARAPLKSVA